MPEASFLSGKTGAETVLEPTLGLCKAKVRSRGRGRWEWVSYWVSEWMRGAAAPSLLGQKSWTRGTDGQHCGGRHLFPEGPWFFENVVSFFLSYFASQCFQFIVNFAKLHFYILFMRSFLIFLFQVYLE